jgi:cystathionine beta-lyase/cystathionine gamma-synthase
MATDLHISERHKQAVAGGDATRCVHAGEERDGNVPLAVPVVQTSVFKLGSLDELRRLNSGAPGYIYSRYANPTTRVAEEKIAALEGAEDCVVTSSGMAAAMAILLATCSAGDEIVAMQDLYGGTVKLFEKVFSRFGVTTRFVPYAEIDSIERALSKKTALLFLESPANPTLRCVDLRRLSAMAHAHGAKVVVDNTFATPVLQKPLSLGADISYHSATKLLGGHSDVTAGAVCGSKEIIARVREAHILSGGTLDPSASYLLIRGLKTLSLRVERGCENAMRIAEALSGNRKVAGVMYPGLPGDRSHALAASQMKGFGTLVTLELAGGGAAAERFIDGLKLWCLATTLGGVESTVSYPLLSSHLGLTDEQLGHMGVSAATVRLSVGIEEAGDLIDDLEQALEKC